MQTVRIVCNRCLKEKERRFTEVKRQLAKGTRHFFCSRECANATWSETLTRSEPTVEKMCAYCGQQYSAIVRKGKPTDYCSRSCASKGSVTDYRRQRAAELGSAVPDEKRVDMLSQSLRSREWHKYESVHDLLNDHGIEHEFEFYFEDEPAYFDLALPDQALIVEFDGPCHSNPGEQRRDREKERLALSYGWDVVRIPEPINMDDVGELLPL